MYLAYGWKDYEIIDAGNDEKLERWGKVILLRPDPQAIWPMKSTPYNFERCHQSIGNKRPAEVYYPVMLLEAARAAA